MPRGYGSPTAHTNGGEGGDQNTTFPRSDSGFFHTFPSARAPPTIPVPQGLDPATLALFQNFDPRHHTKGPRRPPEHRHHRPPPPPFRSLPMAPLPRPGTCARSQAAPADLNAHLGILSCRRRSTETRNRENLDYGCTASRYLIIDRPGAPGCVRRSRADALVPLGAI